jgi:hypothetical protein
VIAGGMMGEGDMSDRRYLYVDRRLLVSLASHCRTSKEQTLSTEYVLWKMTASYKLLKNTFDRGKKEG